MCVNPDVGESKFSSSKAVKAAFREIANYHDSPVNGILGGTNACVI